MNIKRWWNDGILIRLEVNGEPVEITDQIRKSNIPPRHTVQARKIKAEPWPLVLIPLRVLAAEGDRGAGDIIERTIGPIGGDAFKKWYKALFGKDCGCGRRQETLNARWPL